MNMFWTKHSISFDVKLLWQNDSSLTMSCPHPQCIFYNATQLKVRATKIHAELTCCTEQQYKELLKHVINLQHDLQTLVAAHIEGAGDPATDDGLINILGEMLVDMVEVVDEVNGAAGVAKAILEWDRDLATIRSRLKKVGDGAEVRSMLEELDRVRRVSTELLAPVNETTGFGERGLGGCFLEKVEKLGEKIQVVVDRIEKGERPGNGWMRRMRRLWR
ncbi:hypothetical protein EDC01DRAFT_626538 [Geopyxis carbonaria]|nr:hypothetical protein EDC01DRAFT_626538 [Geopyxis carbonaria]